MIEEGAIWIQSQAPGLVQFFVPDTESVAGYDAANFDNCSFLHALQDALWYEAYHLTTIDRYPIPTYLIVYAQELLPSHRFLRLYTLVVCR